MTHDCEGCGFFNPWLSICADEIVFVNKDTGERVWCRYEKGSITLEEYEFKRKEGRKACRLKY